MTGSQRGLLGRGGEGGREDRAGGEDECASKKREKENGQAEEGH